MMLRASVERWSTALPHLVPLFPLHWKEVAMGKTLDMDYRAYARLERSGGLIVVCLWHERVLVGYWTLLISPALHERTLRTATTDLLFIHPEFRSGGAFKMLYEKAHETLLSRGVKAWFVGEKVRRPIGPLLKKYGFAQEEISWVKLME